MRKARYILNHGVTGDIHTAPLLTDKGAKTKFDLSKPEELTQQDLEYLYENKYTNLIMKIEPPVVEKETKPEKKKSDKA